MNEYALYQGDTFISCGTIPEISAETGISEKNLRYYMFESYEKRHENGRKLVKIEMDYEKKLTPRQCRCFGFMLKQKRIDNKISRKKLAEKLGYSESLIQKWETLEKVPNYYNVEDVATYFKLPMNIFIGEE